MVDASRIGKGYHRLTHIVIASLVENDAGLPTFHNQRLAAAKAEPVSSTSEIDSPSLKTQPSTSSSNAAVRRSPRAQILVQMPNGQAVFANGPREDVSAEETPTTPRKKAPKMKGPHTLDGAATPSKRKKKKTPTKPLSTVRLERGRMVPSLQLNLKYGGDNRKDIGARIEKILNPTGRPVDQVVDTKSAAATHPFFLAKATEPTKVPAENTNAEVKKDTPAPATKDWNSLGLKGRKSERVEPAAYALWPPRSAQSTELVALPARNDVYLRPSKSKQKQRRLLLPAEEDVLEVFGVDLRQQHSSDQKPLLTPHRAMLSDEDLDKLLLNLLDRSHREPNIIRADVLLKHLRSCATREFTRASRGEQGGHLDWATKYAPRESALVLQPHSGELADWLRRFSIRDTQKSGNIAPGKRKAKRRKKAGLQDEIDDFIVSSEDDEPSKTPLGTALVLCGPSGCGKTAAVYAVAREYDFEVFEIHPGMRRSSRDIFDKVGDMTLNHLVRTATTSSGVSGADSPLKADLPPPSVQTFFKTKSSIVSAASQKSKSVDREAPPKRSVASQKESLVLLEEVDILFDDDKAFWAGVIALIEQSKRPVVMTCNDLRNIPLDELPAYQIVEFTSVPFSIACSYLESVAAMEGHLLDSVPVSKAYEYLHYDLRATLNELQFWCQLGVGSQQAGLDWLPDLTQKDSHGKPLRVTSERTYRNMLDLREQEGRDESHMDLMQAAHTQYELSIPELHLSTFDVVNRYYVDDEQSIGELRSSAQYSDYLSVLDTLDASMQPLLSDSIRMVFATYHYQLIGEDVVGQRLIHQHNYPDISRRAFHTALEALEIEKSTFPPATGRLAPSLEGCFKNLALDIAPYVRSIAAFDLQLGKHRDELEGGSQGKSSRRTRAARAAFEGGSKASTRRERWFAPSMDLASVLATGGEWPKWGESTMPSSSAETRATSVASSQNHE